MYIHIRNGDAFTKYIHFVGKDPLPPLITCLRRLCHDTYNLQ